ncbi:MAG: hypothetical protein K9N46_03130 [Candidatus Marinimicrobia bacterium]|nr:hypothetical protein [Candidatus Neomarinimicrobiota bacterium]MCF7828109.1 hypothetical protein [Candidatus Neomarinimicrobiota bacterium]MCF7879716.1 hypothetical protein [Candidatus Neomarinimicrobiota bacterium]
MTILRAFEVNRWMMYVCMAMYIPAIFAGTIYVDASASGNNDGTDWSNAHTSLQSALNAASSGDEIWVAKGTYYPSSVYSLTNTSRYYHFEMINGVTIYGGFAGTESAVAERTSYGSGETNETTLSGDIGTVGDNSDNCYHIFYHRDNTSLNNTAILDGFTISDGNASGSSPHTSGGGIYNYYNSPRIRNCVFIDNSASSGGGGMYNGTGSPALLENCQFISNTSQYGGGVHNSSAAATFKNCVFRANSANLQGGGMYNYANYEVTVTNCLFYQNTTGTGTGGGVYNYSNGPVFNNCTFTENIASNGGGVSNRSGSVQTYNNCIFWSNSASSNGDEIYMDGGTGTTLNYSCYQNEEGDIYGTLTTSHCINTDPQFVGVLNNSDHPYSIGGISPCADAGDNTYNSEPYDIRGPGFPRTLNKLDGTSGTIDMGAYEYKIGTDASLPVTLSSFIATAGNGEVTLRWTTESEIDNLGFNIYRSYSESGIYEKLNSRIIPGAGSSPDRHEYSYTDTYLANGTTYWYKLGDVDFSGYTVLHGPMSATPCVGTVPVVFRLYANYPNPFNPVVVIPYDLSGDSYVRVCIYDVAGNLVRDLYSGRQVPGSYTLRWDGTGQHGRAMPSGLYLIHLKAGTRSAVSRVTLVR